MEPRAENVLETVEPQAEDSFVPELTDQFFLEILSLILLDFSFFFFFTLNLQVEAWPRLAYSVKMKIFNAVSVFF